MAHTSTMLALGTTAPGFTLFNTNPEFGGELVSLEDYAGSRAILVAFICNHCPYVVHLKPHFAKMAASYQDKGLAVIAISANDASGYPQDGPDAMSVDSKEYGYRFPYLFDEDQHVARAFEAACTPDFYLFDGGLSLVYRGQYDSSRPGSGQAATGADLCSAIDAVLNGGQVDANQIASMGCNIKWKPGNEPEYFYR